MSILSSNSCLTPTFSYVIVTRGHAFLKWQIIGSLFIQIWALFNSKDSENTCIEK